jgi:hypothetical protein
MTRLIQQKTTTPPPPASIPAWSVYADPTAGVTHITFDKVIPMGKAPSSDPPLLREYLGTPFAMASCGGWFLLHIHVKLPTRAIVSRGRTAAEWIRANTIRVCVGAWRFASFAGFAVAIGLAVPADSPASQSNYAAGNSPIICYAVPSVCARARGGRA